MHIHALWEEIQHRAARVARELGMPYVITPHGMLDPWSLRQSKWKKRLYLALRMRNNLNGAAAIHYTSDIERDLAAPLRLKPPTIVEPNGVDLAEFDDLPPRGTFRAKHPQLGRPADRAVPRPRAPEEGAGPARPRVRAGRAEGRDAGDRRARTPTDTPSRSARSPGSTSIADRVLFTGMLRGRERIEAFVDADLFALPSYQENFGIAVVEALAAAAR